MAYEWITKYSSPNFGRDYTGQTGTNDPKYIVIHHWGADSYTWDGTIATLCNGARGDARVSAHLVVEAGRVACLVDYANSAWHTGDSWYNSHSIGIECRPLCTDGDIETLEEVIADLYSTYGVLPLIGHKDIRPTACPGRYYSRLAEIQAKATAIYQGATAAPIKAKAIKHLPYTRIAGADRYETARLIADQHAKSNKVIISGRSYPDGMTAAYFAYRHNANIEYADDKASAGLETWIIGGGVDNRYFASVLAGADRYGTNLDAVKDLIKIGDTVLVASGKTWDGVSAATVRLPLLIVDDLLKVSQITELAAKGIKGFVILGGTGAVKPEIETQLSEIAPCERIAGRDRYETSMLITNRFYKSADTVIVINDWSDGITASCMGDMPILLVGAGHTGFAQRYAEVHGTKQAIVIGGVDDDTAKRALEIK